MSQCPHCHGELTPDPSNPQKLLCYNCKKRYDASAVDGYWAGQAQQSQAPVQNQPYDPYSAAQQPQTPQQQPVMQQPYSPQPAQDPYMGQPPMGGQPTMAPTGYPGGQPQPAYMQPPRPGKGLAITALVLGILAVLGSVIPLFNVVAILCGLVAVILGIVAAVKASKGTAGGMGFGIAGIICGVLGIIVAIAINVFTIDLVNEAVENGNFNNINELVENLENENFNFNNANEVNGIVNGNTNTNSNTNSNTNVNTNANENGQTLTPPVLPPVNVSSNWMDGQIGVDGYVLTLGKTTLKDLQSNTALYLDLAAAGYANGYVVNPGSSVSTISLDYTGAESLSCYVTVANPSNEIKDISECVITTFDITKPYRNEDPAPQVEAPGGIKFGSSQQDVIAAYGEPKDKSQSGDYSSFTYDDGNYNKYIEISFDNGTVDEIRMRIYL